MSFFGFGTDDSAPLQNSQDSSLARKSILELKLSDKSTYVFGDFGRAEVVEKIKDIIDRAIRYNFESDEYKYVFKIDSDRKVEADYRTDVAKMKDEMKKMRTFSIKSIKDYDREIGNTDSPNDELKQIKIEINKKFELMEKYIKFYKFDSLLVDHTINIMTIRAISLVKDLQGRQEKLVDQGDYPQILQSLDMMEGEASDFNLINELESLLATLSQNIETVSAAEEPGKSQSTPSESTPSQAPAAAYPSRQSAFDSRSMPQSNRPSLGRPVTQPYDEYVGGESTANIATSIEQMKSAFTNAKNLFKARREFLNNFIERLVTILQNGFLKVKELFYEKYQGRLTVEMQKILKDIAKEFEKHTYTPPKDTKEELDRVIQARIGDLKNAESGVGQRLGKRGLEKMAKMYVELDNIYQEINNEIGPVTR